MGELTMMSRVLLLSVLVMGASGISLTEKNFDSETAGKTAFIEFQAPW